MWHVSIDNDGYHNECWRCGNFVHFGAELSVDKPAKNAFLEFNNWNTIELDLITLQEQSSTWHMVITDLDAGGDHDNSPHGMELHDALAYGMNWFSNNTKDSVLLASDFIWSSIKEHHFSGKKYVDFYCDSMENFIATLWEE
jgi:hypothetical protein